MCVSVLLFFFFKQKTAYEMRISDWSSDVCSSDLLRCVMTLATVAQPQTKLAPQLDERAVAVQQLHKPHALGFGGCPGADCLAFDDVEGIERDAQLETLFSFELRNQRHQRFAQGGRQ